MSGLPCDNGGGSLNNPNTPPTTPTAPYVPPDICKGTMELSSVTPDLCLQTDQLSQESYVAEMLQTSGAPINIYKLLGVHEQGDGSVLTAGTIIASQPAPGYPISNINSSTGVWRSIEAGSATQNNSYVGLDFGVKRLPNGTPEYQPPQTKWIGIAALQITQSNLPNNFARQVKVEINDGAVYSGGVSFGGAGSGTLAIQTIGQSATQSTVRVMATSATEFAVLNVIPGQPPINLGVATVGATFHSPVVTFTISAGMIPFLAGDMFTINLSYEWKRVGIFNLIQSPAPQLLNLQSTIRARAVRVTPVMFTGTGNWEVSALDVLDSPPTDINNIQDLFFNENRDRDYATAPILLKAQYNPADSASDLSRFGLSILDQYAFNFSFAMVVQALGRPIVVGDILEVIPEMQYDHNLKPIRKFLEVTDTGWASEGYSTQWKPTILRVTAQQALPSQETRDIFGTLDTQKFLVADPILGDNVAEQLDITPLTQTEEIVKAADDAVPETGDKAAQELTVPIHQPLPPVNPKGQPAAVVQKPAPKGKQNIYVEDGLPKNGEPYGEGYKLPAETSATDGEYFRLYYPDSTRIAPRLYRFSSVKNRWLFLEQDRRQDAASHKPSAQQILQSNTRVSLGK